MKRRKFLKAAVWAGAASAGTGIYFPKPVTAFTFNRLLSDNSPGRIQGNFVAANVAREVGYTLPPDLPQGVINVVQTAQTELTNRLFSEQQTPYAQRRETRTNLLWGRQKQEELGLNAGFGTVQIVNNYAEPITFTGATTTGIDTGIQALEGDENFTPVELDDTLIPIKMIERDTDAWGEDGSTIYETRVGEVIRTYRIQEPGPGGFGVITFQVFSSLGRYDITTEVRFS